MQLQQLPTFYTKKNPMKNNVKLVVHHKNWTQLEMFTENSIEKEANYDAKKDLTQ